MLSLIILLSVCLAQTTQLSQNPEEIAGLFEGDIAGIEMEWDYSKGAYSIPTKLRSLWTSGVVPYIYDAAAAFTKAEKDAILAGMRMVEDATRLNGRNCVSFVPRTNHNIYLKIIRGKGCYSQVGKKFLPGGQDISLGDGCHQPVIVAHELIHALGWYHEQSRPDRDDFVNIYYENIKQGMEMNFAKMTTSQVGQLEFPYDYDSIMHYETTAFSVNGEPTILPNREGAVIGQRTHLSVIDVSEIRSAYKCS